MRRSVKRAVVIGVAGMLAALSVLTAGPAAANASCAGGGGSLCSDTQRAFTNGGVVNRGILAERGDSATSNQTEAGLQRDFDRVTAGDRVR